jgi:hypothetical protein
VRYFEVGNEIYSPDQPGHASAQQYAARLKQFATTMRARDPAVCVGAVLEASFQQAQWMRKLQPQLFTWNETVLGLAGRDLDFVAIHFYAPFDKPWSNDEIARLLWAGVDVLDTSLDTLRAQLQRLARPGTAIALTEYAAFFGGKLAPDARSAGTESAMFNAMVLMKAIATPEVTLANHWSLFDNNVFGMWSKAAGAPRERAFAPLFAELARWSQARVIPLTVEGGAYRVMAKGNVPALFNVSSVRAVAARHGDGSLGVALVSREPREVQHISLAVKDPTVARFSLAIRVASNDRTGWQPLVRASIGKVDGRFHFDLPPHSFVIMTAGP